MGKRIGIFGGTFNPVHNGHIRLVKLYKEALKLDRVIVIPTNIPPHKTIRIIAGAQDRLQMLKLAFEPYDFVTVSNIEIKASGKSYTIDTVTKLKELYPDDEFFLIIGGDMFLCFDTWREYEKLLSLCKVCTAPREKGELVMLKVFQKKLDQTGERTKILDIPVMVLSSSQIRKCIKNGSSTEGLIPNSVADYIVQKGLYKND